MAEQPPTVYVIAGPNGAGKTTFAMTLLPNYANCREFLNADLIATGLSPFAPESQAVAAGRLMLKRLEECIAAHATFAMETTLSGKSYAKTFRKMKSFGFRIAMCFLWLSNPDLAVGRVSRRVSQGGHNVPVEDVRRRWQASIQNLFTLYRPILDELHLFDSSSMPPRLVLREVDGNTEVLDGETLERIKSSAGVE